MNACRSIWDNDAFIPLDTASSSLFRDQICALMTALAQRVEFLSGVVVPSSAQELMQLVAIMSAVGLDFDWIVERYRTIYNTE